MAHFLWRGVIPRQRLSPLDVRPSQNFIQSVPQDVYIQDVYKRQSSHSSTVRCLIKLRTSLLKVRIEPRNTADSGRMFPASPAWKAPMVRTQGSKGLTSRLTNSWRVRKMCIRDSPQAADQPVDAVVDLWVHMVRPAGQHDNFAPAGAGLSDGFLRLQPQVIMPAVINLVRLLCRLFDLSFGQVSHVLAQIGIYFPHKSF